MPYELDYPTPFKGAGKIFSVAPFRQLGAGPTNFSAKVLQAMTFEPLTPVSPQLFEILDEIREMAKYVFQTSNPLTLVSQTSGNGGNEAMVVNLADPKDTILVAVSGLWGIKVAQMGRRYNLNVVELKVEPGEVYSFEELEKAIVKHKPVTLFVTHGESTGGTLQPLDGLADICHKYGCLLAVDCTISLAIVPIFADKWKLDAVSSGTQKGLGSPAGLSLLTFSPRAHERMKNKKSPTPYIYDILALADVWSCFSEAKTYHYTFSSALLLALRQALTEICEEGLENVWERHKNASELFLSKLPALGVSHFVKKPENRLLGVNCVVLPEGISWPAIRKYLIEKYGIEISFGVGPTGDEDQRTIRIGFLGTNARPAVVEYFLDALKNAIKYYKENADLTLNNV